MERADRLRISFIEFLNAVPLGWGFLHGSFRGRYDVWRQTPAECADSLREGRVDVGLIPIVEYQRIPGLQVVPDLAIASRNEVRSVLFLTRKPLDRIRRVAVDPRSRTSVALLQILFWEFLGRQGVEIVPEEPNVELMLRDYDGALVIGNSALRIPMLEGVMTHDLAAEWNRFTGLPFVFACWTVRSGLDLHEEVEVFGKSLQEGLANIPLIAEWYSSRLGLPAEEIRRYLTRNLSYSLDETAEAGAREFFRLAHRWKLIPEPQPLRFVTTRVQGNSVTS